MKVEFSAILDILSDVLSSKNFGVIFHVPNSFDNAQCDILSVKKLELFNFLPKVDPHILLNTRIIEHSRPPF